VKKVMRWLVLAVVLASTSLATSVQADTCDQLPTYAELKAALLSVTALAQFNAPPFGGDLHPGWLALLDGSGVVCAVVAEVAGDVTRTQSGLYHRRLAVYKGATAGGFSHSLISLASGHFYWITLPGGPMWGATLPALGVEASDGPEPDSVSTWGTPADPFVGQHGGGFSQLAGGLALFDASKHKVGSIGVSGNPFCTAHAVAWRVRELLADRNGTVGAYTYRNVPSSVACGGRYDALILDVQPDVSGVGGPGVSPSGFGYPVCNFFPPEVQTFANGIQDATCSP